jgi:serine/threonine protein kinase
MARLARNHTQGGWRLLEELGRGGNARVWLCEPEAGGEKVAVKFLTRLERYERFRREVEFHRRRRAHPGVLPLLDAHLPGKPTSDDYPWLSMPRATSIDDALRSAPLERVVQAIADVAGALTELAREGVHHRDLKPGNLYRHEERWVVGDFGLIYIPDAESLSASDEVIGPFGYVPSELFTDPTGADPERTDVYELAKTLWVLATEARWPPQGSQHPIDDATSISRYRPHRLADQFDRMIESGTRPEARRPGMAEFRDQLGAWLELERSRPMEPRVDAIFARVREQSQGYADENERRNRLIASFEDALRELNSLLAPLRTHLVVALPHIGGLVRDGGVQEVLRSLEGATDFSEIYLCDSLAVSATFGTEHTFFAGASVELTNEGELVVTGGYFVDLGMYDQTPELRTRTERAPVGTVSATAALERVAAQLTELLPEALALLSQELA